jgi:hypothetical protein
MLELRADEDAQSQRALAFWFLTFQKQKEK